MDSKLESELAKLPGQAAFASFYEKNFKASSIDTIRFFDRKGFYTVHDKNAVYVADTYYKTQAAIKTYSGLTSTSLSPQTYQTTVRDLLCERGYRVELWTGSAGSWTLARQVRREASLPTHFTQRPVVAGFPGQPAGLRRNARWQCYVWCRHYSCVQSCVGWWSRQGG